MATHSEGDITVGDEIFSVPPNRGYSAATKVLWHCKIMLGEGRVANLS